MKKGIGYTEHKGKAVVTDGRFQHVMAIALDPRTGYKEGVIRCITARDGDVQVSGYVDRSVLHRVDQKNDGAFAIGKELKIANRAEIVDSLLKKTKGEGWDFIGLEDPDIWIDEKTNQVHFYCTLPIIHKTLHTADIHLAHAVGDNLDSLTMTEPSLMAIRDDIQSIGAKELSIAPINSRGFRYNLIESGDLLPDFHYSVVRTAIVEDMGKPWKYGNIVFHPADHKIPWIGGHASPGPLLPKSFIDLGENKLLGIMNGREANQKIGEKIKYGMFSVGLFIYDYEQGKIDWVSPKPFIQDSEAITITFASQFIEGSAGTGTLYAHVDDSFVRAYTLDAAEIKTLLP